MKKALLFSAALAALTLVSCNKEVKSSAVLGDGKPVEVTVSIQGAPGTRATETTYANESKVNTLQVFVFAGDDREAYKSVASAMQALIPATSGERTVWAVVNAPDLSAVTSLSGLRAAVTNLSDNAVDGFVMTGSKTQELVDGGNVPITVKRIVSRVSIAKISTDLKEYRVNYSLKLKGIYMINVAGDNKYDVGGEASSWINKLGHADAAYDALLYDEIASVEVKNGTPYVKEHAFYPYPNIHPTDAESASPVYSSTWNPRGSILVIEAEMYDDANNAILLENGTSTGYYPIILPALERNKTYVIEEVCITRMPGSVPYEPITTGESQVTISVADWEVGLNLGTITI